MKGNQYKPTWKTIYIVQEQPIKQSSLSPAARNKIANRNQIYQSRNPKSYGPCIPFNQNCECSLEELQRQEQVLKNREIEERIRRRSNEENQQGRNEQEINLQNQLTNLQRSFQELQEENLNAVQALGINNLSDLPTLLDGENLTSLLNRATQRRQSNWWWSNSSTNAELQRITTERNEARENLQTIQQQLQDEQDAHQQTQRQLTDANNIINDLTDQRNNLQGIIDNTQVALGVNNLGQLPTIPQGQNLQSLFNFYNEVPQDWQAKINELNNLRNRQNNLEREINLHIEEKNRLLEEKNSCQQQNNELISERNRLSGMVSSLQNQPTIFFSCWSCGHNVTMETCIMSCGHFSRVVCSNAQCYENYRWNRVTKTAERNNTGAKCSYCGNDG